VTVVGVLGGGQLGRMLALAGVPLGMRCICVEPAPDPPAAVAAEVLRAPFDDPDALAALARRCDVVTVELEHVPADALAWLAERVPVRPSPEAVATAQDRLLEKQALRAAGVGTAPFAAVGEQPAGFAEGTIVKVRTGGYDGRGQVWLPPGGDVVAAAQQLGAPSIAEGVVAFRRELSVVAARGLDGTIACWPVVENEHADGILAVTRAPASGVDAGQRKQAETIAQAWLERFDYAGVVAVELFDTAAGLLANEVAPRVHNSGHWTIEGAVTSQFEQHLRAITGLPLGDPSTAACSAMVNLIGTLPDIAAVLAVPGAHLHLYGKAPRPGRKLGHVTVVAPDEGARDASLARVRGLVRAGLRERGVVTPERAG
jgi:5-(carboxyamino)imidazole ribonucleotide synthase